MNRLGIYFGPQAVSIVEAKGKLPINNIQIPHAAVLGGEVSEEKVPGEIKIATLLKDELIKNKIEAKEATIILPGKDLIIRTFEMPPLPQRELYDAVNFEVKKYIPFKVEDLASDFQWKLDKSSKKIYILFIGIKKETLNKYLSIFKQINLKITAIEYSAFSILRLLKLLHIKEKGAVAVVDIDLVENDEANFVVLEDDLPLFSRDIVSLGVSQGEAVKSEEATSAGIFEKLKREILISINYYDRKFPGRKTGKVFFIMHPVYPPDAEIFKDMGVGVQVVDINKYIGRDISLPLSSLKAYSGCLLGIDTKIRVNLLAVRKKPIRKISIEQVKEIPLIVTLKSKSKLLVACLSVCLLVFLYGAYQVLVKKSDLRKIGNMRPKFSLPISAKAGYQELNSLYSEYAKKIKALDSLIKEPLHLTLLLDTIARLVPKGMWLTSLSFENKREEKKVELLFSGVAYLGDNIREIELVNSFISDSKKNTLFAKYFKEIKIISLENRTFEKGTQTYFRIACRNYKERQ